MLFFDGFSQKTNHLLRANMSNCYEKIITISPKLATLSSGQIFDDTQTDTHTHTQTQRLPKYMADFILPCNKTVILGQSIDKSVIWGRGRQELRDGASGEENWEAGQTSSHRGSRCRSAKNLKRNRNDRQTWQDCVKCTRQITRFRL